MHRYTQIIHAHGAYTIFTYAYTRVSTNSESCFPSLARRLLSLFKKASRSSHERCLRQSLRHERRPKTLPTVATFQESLKQYSSRTRDPATISDHCPCPASEYLLHSLPTAPPHDASSAHVTCLQRARREKKSATVAYFLVPPCDPWHIPMHISWSPPG